TTASTSCASPLSTRSGSAFSRSSSVIEGSGKAVRRPRSAERELHVAGALLERVGQIAVDEIRRVLVPRSRVGGELRERSERALAVEARVHVRAAARRLRVLAANAELHPPAHAREHVPQLLAATQEERA